MRVALIQMNSTVGDIKGNATKLIEQINLAKEQGAQLAVAPELCVPGYPPLDLLERKSFVSACLEEQKRVVDSLPEGLVVVFGGITIRQKETSYGKKLLNSAIVAQKCQILTTVAKSLLPTYDVFDESRYFEPKEPSDSATFEYHNKKIGVSICEDLWNDADLVQSKTLWPADNLTAPEGYQRDPIVDICSNGDVDLLVNLSASPWARQKTELRYKILSHVAQKHSLDVVYVNAVGGNDGLLFDGHSQMFSKSGSLLVQAKGWQEAVIVHDLDSSSQQIEPQASEIENIQEALTLGIRDYFHKTGLKSAVVGLSGGIDSAVTCYLAVRALGAENVVGVSMPSKYSSEHSIADARLLAENLKIEFQLVSIAEPNDVFLSALAPVFEGLPADVTEENLQSRIRGLLLMAIANKRGAVVLGTGNKSEASVGYATLYGDTIGAISVLADLYKHQVYALAEFANISQEIIPRSTIIKPPSAELRPDQKDSDSLPEYDVLDKILESFIEYQKTVPEIAQELNIEESLVQDIINKVYHNEFKRRQMPPTLRICNKAWVGRIYPIVQKFRG